VCHRALVFDRGRVVAECRGDELSVENLLAAASARVGHEGLEGREGRAVTEI
jgi:ribose transport system ATP-binding protein